jgi:hypothetical protein
MSLYAIFATAVCAYPLRRISTLPVYLYANTAAASSLFVLIFLESTSKRRLLIPTDPVSIVGVPLLLF